MLPHIGYFTVTSIINCHKRTPEMFTLGDTIDVIVDYININNEFKIVGRYKKCDISFKYRN